MAGFMETLRDRAGRQIVVNVQALKGGQAPPGAEARAKRWWDLPAKVEVARRIQSDELARSKADARDAGAPNAHNNRFDAMRHARASQRLAEAAGPRFAEVAGNVHEGVNAFEQLVPAILDQGIGGPYEVGAGRTPGQYLDEIRMDLHNNAEGRAAAREGRPIDRRRLKVEPSPPPASALYRSPPPSRTGLPPR